MLDALPEQKIRESWEGLIIKIGDFKEVISTKEVETQGYKQIQKRCKFANENASIKVTFNEENKVVGLFITL